MGDMRRWARLVAHHNMSSMGRHVNSKRAGRSPFAEHWRECAPKSFETPGKQVRTHEQKEKIRMGRRLKIGARP